MNKFQVHISDEDIKEILPNYLKKKLAEIIILEELFNKKDYPAIRSIAHNIKGTAASYGLEGAGDIAATLEAALKLEDHPTAFIHFKSLKEYFDNLEIVYA